MSALTGNINQSIVNNQRSDETLPRGFSIAIQFLHGATALRSRFRCGSGDSRKAEARKKRGQASGEVSSGAASE
jgi:hypothetical protein